MTDQDQFPTMEIVCRTKAGRRLMSTTTGPTFTALVSIGDLGSRPPTGFNKVAPRIRLEFDDVDGLGPQWYTPPSKEDVQRLIKFANMLAGKPGKVLIHCFAGISRSTAAGFILNSVFLGSGREKEAMDLTVAAAVNSGTDPNRLMVRYADELLKRDGKMEAARSVVFDTGTSMY